MSSKHLLVNKSRLFWLFTFDTLKLQDSLRNISRQLAESPLIQGWTYYYDPSERHLGLSEIMVKNEAEPELGTLGEALSKAIAEKAEKEESLQA